MAHRRPPPGSQVYWRFTGGRAYRYGYVTYVGGCDLLRMGCWNGDTHIGGGPVVSVDEIEWRPYK